MFMTVISLAISLVSIQSFHSLSQQESSSNQTPQSHRVQKENKDAAPPKVLLNIPRTTSVTPIALPSGDNAWTVQIVSRGGLAGSGRGDLTVTSEGILIWSGADGSCSRKLTGEAMQALAKSVLAADAPATSSEGPLSGLCGDCYVTTMILRRGRAGVAVRASAVYWDDVSQANVPAEMMTIYEAVMAHRGCKL